MANGKTIIASEQIDDGLSALKFCFSFGVRGELGAI
jgi:hypothetical protein